MAMSNNELAEKIDAQVHMLNNHYVLGGVALAQGRLDEAFIYLEKSARICEQSMYKFPVARILATQSMTLARIGKSHEAWSLIVEALEYGVKLHSYINLSFALPGAAFLMAISGKYEDTLELWGLIEEKTMCGKSPWLEDVVGKPIKELASSIPLEVIKAAKARGRTMDLFDTAAALLNEFEGKQA
jgi:hypothetical protein